MDIREDPADGRVARVSEASALRRMAATVERLSAELRRTRAAADGRAVVELARGVLVERLRCGPAQAARQLAALAERAGVAELELAADIVGRAAQDRLADAAGDGRGDGAERRPDTAGAAAGEGRRVVGGDGRVASAGEETWSASVRLRVAESAVLGAGDCQAVAEAVLGHALGPLGAVAVAVWAVGADSSLSLAGAAGFAVGEAGRWRYVPPGVPTAARRALTERGTVRIEDLAGAGLVSIGDRHLPGGRVVALAAAGGRVLGVLEICWPGPPPRRPPSVVRQVEALAELCAHAVESDALAGPAPHGPSLVELVDLADGLLDPALVLLPETAGDGRVVDFRLHHLNAHFKDLAGRSRASLTGARLLEAYPLAATGGGLFDAVERVHATGEPFRAERMALTVQVDDVPLTVTASAGLSRHGDRVLLVWRPLDETALLADLLQHAQRLGRIGGFEEDVTKGLVTWNSSLYALHGLATPVPLAELPAHAHPDDAAALHGFLRTVLHHRKPASTAFRLRRPDEITRHIRVIAEPVLDPDGRLVAVRGAYQDASAQHWTEVALSATRDQLAHSERLAAEQNRLALQLQQAIMPPAQRTVDAFDLRISVRYRPAEIEHLVGGDWYDAAVLPSERVLVSVGDITGHGIKSATGMVVLRNALRGLAATGAGPGQLLTWLNLVAHHLADHLFATAVCGLYDPDTRVLRWARAGHLPPVLVRGGRASTLPMLRGVMLGALAEAEYEEGRVELRPGDTLLLYTDGLVERRNVDLDDCVRWLVTASEAFTGSLERRLDDLLARSESDTDDDACIVGLHLG
ncbi:SpoIIE family protein phosphatase [Umezawaea endophytica]|uniref:SpoIIE family protein phosphatase n=1 Tax=Umezawaea endophytica TaxID=1654476 RepID=A0A9X2VNP7_9PSEU|nr:PP2C family protein-serine/threonine phosphatase [Umezawaea endophytica]MCS7479469.1 SpoIIE family protein phosphatase [Umezawaea endophytica]